MVKWLGAQAEELGAEIYPGFAAAEVLYHEDGSVKGVATGAMGLDRNGEPKANFEPGIELHARHTLFAEGCRGSLTKQLESRFGLRTGCDPQTYAIGIKELWEVAPEQHRPGRVVHTIGWPLDQRTYGGSFIYHLSERQVAVGFVIGLDYQNPWLAPFEEFQRFKTHPAIRGTFEGGRRICYGARALNEGGLQAIPKLVFPGGALIGCAAGFLNVPKIKGNHTAMKSGMLAAEAVFEALAPAAAARGLSRGAARVLGVAGAASGAQHPPGLPLRPAAGPRPRRARHLPAARQGALDAPSSSRPPAAQARQGLPADRLPQARRQAHLRPAVVGLHLEHQPRRQPALPPAAARRARAGRAQPRQVRGARAALLPGRGLRDRARGRDVPRLQINYQNCVHCKTCDIKDPSQNINWVVPQGGDGPNYVGM